ncbi:MULTISPECIES: hypothetical protein [unclassified Roseateles]|uniref:hypothetical protein n=1 Tax=unclassified Roseateles TaxID=2626991 RepID=UPI0006F660FB|nr:MULTISPECIES: hypothetical protein [unclassified Roseateles]KQW45300.1 hypothetical protein ASC81_10205 [Pelomonas sp. Root405]KRA72146.1 hypothetical protein ASD88_10210 [Pelomonas sp. Root662]
MKPVLKGGFPVAFLSAQPGVSIERQPSFGEDIFHNGAFASNTALHFLAIGLFGYFIGRRLQRSSDGNLGATGA